MLKSGATLVLVLLLLLPLSAALAQEDDDTITDPDIVEAIRLYRENKLDDAMAAVQRALTRNPNDAVAHNAAGIVLSKQGKYDEALEHFNTAIKNRKGFFKAIYNKLNLLISTNKAEEALAYLKDITAEYPDHADGWINLGVLTSQMGNIQEAIGYFDKAVALNGKDFDAIFKRSQLQLLLKRYADCRAGFARVLELRPGHTGAAQGLSIVDDIIEKKNQGYIHVRQILVASPAIAQQVKSELDAGGNFIQLARKYSADATAKYGGDLGFVGKGQLLKAIEDAIFGLQVGQVSEVVRTARGYHLFYREE